MSPPTSRQTKTFARALRRQLTPAEVRLWQRLRNGAFPGIQFRRQLPIGPYIADFACLQPKIVVELDGGQHADAQSYDAARTE